MIRFIKPDPKGLLWYCGGRRGCEANRAMEAFGAYASFVGKATFTT